jgi:hypothetical protein
MKHIEQGPRNGPKNKDRSINNTPADNAPGREGGDDALTEASPTDERADEKVIVNQQRENQAVNAPSQTAFNPNNSEDII